MLYKKNIRKSFTGKCASKWFFKKCMYIMEIHTPLYNIQIHIKYFTFSCDDDGKWRWKGITLVKCSNYPSGTLARCRRRLFETVLKQQNFTTFIKYKQLWDIDTVACWETVMYSWLINNVFSPLYFCTCYMPVSNSSKLLYWKL